MFSRIFVFMIIAFSTGAFAAGAGPTDASPATPPRYIGGDGAGGHPYYQCSSHHTDDDFRLHYGAPSAAECDAKESAIKICEEFEKHKCEIHDCRYFLQ